jgi:hypothetical protein
MIGAHASRYFDYDLNYFVTDPIRPVVNLLEVGNFTGSGLFSLDNEVLEFEMRQHFVEVEDILDHASEQMKEMTARIEVLSSAIENFYSAYLTLYNRCACLLLTVHVDPCGEVIVRGSKCRQSNRLVARLEVEFGDLHLLIGTTPF